MTKNRWLWIIAIVVTLASAVYQRMTGPTYPMKGRATLGGQEFRYRLDRSHETTSDQAVQVVVPDTQVTGTMKWRRHPTTDAYATVALAREGDALTAALPKQPSGGKLEYQLRLERGTAEAVILPVPVAVTRFKDPVSTWVLIPHVLAMFLGMLWSTRAGLAAVAGGPTRTLTWTALGLLVVGGFVLGPIMQHQAFGAYWTGIPFGFDLTDNKTLIAVAAWALAAWRTMGGRTARWEVAAAALVTLVVFAIPHSVWGTQIDWSTHSAGT
jgi:hypothetical protein